MVLKKDRPPVSVVDRAEQPERDGACNSGAWGPRSRALLQRGYRGSLPFRHQSNGGGVVSTSLSR